MDFIGNLDLSPTSGSDPVSLEAGITGTYPAFRECSASLGAVRALERQGAHKCFMLNYMFIWRLSRGLSTQDLALITVPKTGDVSLESLKGPVSKPRICRAPGRTHSQRAPRTANFRVSKKLRCIPVVTYILHDLTGHDL